MSLKGVFLFDLDSSDGLLLNASISAVFRQQICACKGEKGSKRVRFAFKSHEQAPVLIDRGEAPLDDIMRGRPLVLEMEATAHLCALELRTSVFRRITVPCFTQRLFRQSLSTVGFRSLNELRAATPLSRQARESSAVST